MKRRSLRCALLAGLGDSLVQLQDPPDHFTAHNVQVGSVNVQVFEEDSRGIGLL